MRLIDADALKEAMNFNGGCGMCFMYVDDADTIDAIPVEWLEWRIEHAEREGFVEAAEMLRTVRDWWNDQRDIWSDEKEQEAR